MIYPFFSEKFFRNTLLVSLLFNALSAFSGGIGLIFFDGLGMPKSWLYGFFETYVIPGLVLFFIVGGTHLFAAAMVKYRWRYAMESAMVAGFGLQIWIYVELSIIHEASWLQTIYFALGIWTLILTFMLYGRKKGGSGVS